MTGIKGHRNFSCEVIFKQPTLHDVLWRKVADVVVKIFVPCCLLEGEVLGLNEAVQEVALLAVLLLNLRLSVPEA